jgi:hypothetical protein
VWLGVIFIIDLILWRGPFEDGAKKDTFSVTNGDDGLTGG